MEKGGLSANNAQFVSVDLIGEKESSHIRIEYSLVKRDTYAILSILHHIRTIIKDHNSGQ